MVRISSSVCIKLPRALAALLLACAMGASAQTRLLPVDQAASVPDFFSFRAQLQSAVARRDTAAVIAALSRDVKLSFGGDQGIDAFRKMWTPDAPASRLWDVLGSTLALGGAFASEDSFVAPYIYTQWPKEIDPFNHMAVIGSSVRVRSAPNANAGVIGTLDFSVVELAAPTPEDRGWSKIRFAPDKVGFVDARFLRNPVDYRIRFAKTEAGWRVVFFLSGD